MRDPPSPLGKILVVGNVVSGGDCRRSWGQPSFVATVISGGDSCQLGLLSMVGTIANGGTGVSRVTRWATFHGGVTPYGRRSITHVGGRGVFGGKISLIGLWGTEPKIKLVGAP